MNNTEKDLTAKYKVGKLTLKEREIKLAQKTGRMILIVDFSQGGITQVSEYTRKEDSE